MSPKRFAELLAAFALEHPGRPLASVTAIEFAAWHAARARP